MTTEKTIIIIMLFLCPYGQGSPCHRLHVKSASPYLLSMGSLIQGRQRSCLIKRIALEGEQTKISYFSSLKGNGKNWCAECSTAGISCILALEMANSCFLYKNKCCMQCCSFCSLCHVLHVSVCEGCWCSSLLQMIIMVPVHTRLGPLALWLPGPNGCHDSFRFLSLTPIMLKRQT